MATTTSYSTTEKGKMIFNHEGSQYSLGSTRKDGSEVWKCVERDCDGRILKRTVGISADRKCTVIKAHTEDFPSAVRILSHLALTKLKNRALSDLAVPPAQVLKQTMTDIRDTIETYLPSPNDLMTLVSKWRSAEEEPNGVDENIMMTSPPPNNKNNDTSKSSRPKKTPTRKRTKLDAMMTVSPKRAVSVMAAAATASATVSTLQEMNSSRIDDYDHDDDD